MWVLELIDDRNVVQLDVEVLVDALQCALDGYIVLEFDGDTGVDQCLEEAISRR